MLSFLPSEVSRLVLGYLEEVSCKSAYNAFLNDCPHLAECRGRVFFTQIMGYSLVEILDDFCAVQSYLYEMSNGEEFRRKVLKCKSLLEKVKLFTEKDGHETSKPVLVNKCHKATSPLPRASQSYSVHRSIRVRSNSCDSVVSTRTEASTGVGGQLGDKRLPHTRSVESLAEATSLADLPGNKRYSTGSQMRAFNNSFSYRSKLQSTKCNVSKSFNKSSRGRMYESDEETFRSALGLVRHGDLPEKHGNNNILSKTPMKSKSALKKHAMCVKKITHTTDPIPSETLDVTTITHALLDCTEFHEKLAENINKIYSNLSVSRLEDVNNLSALHKSNTETAMRQDVAMVSDEMLPSISGSAYMEENGMDEGHQLDTVIKTIVEKTEKDPIFDQLVNEVLAASVESSTGSDSDIISRPGTSTPEKSSYSQMNESSPTHTWRLAEAIDYPMEKLPRAHFGGKKLQLNNRDKSRLRLSPPCKYSSYSQSQYYARNKKYPRYPRGGKRMDILRETCGSSFCENDEEDPPVSNNRVVEVGEVESEANAKPTGTKAEPKVVILSDEIIRPTIKGPLKIDSLSRKDVPLIISVRKPEETIIKPCKDTGVVNGNNSSTAVQSDINNVAVTRIQTFSDPRFQSRQIKSVNSQLKTFKPFEDESSSLNGAQNVMSVPPNPVRYVNTEQNKTVPLLEVFPQVVNAHNASGSDSSHSSRHTNKNEHNKLRNFRKSTNVKTPVDLDSEKTSNYYSETDIMNMPTVFVDQSGGVDGSQTLVPGIGSVTVAPHHNSLPLQQSNSVQENMNTVTNLCQDVLPTIGSRRTPKLLYREKVPLKSVHGLISSMVNETDGTHVLQIDQGLMSMDPTPDNQIITTQTEIVLTTRSELSFENQNVVDNDMKETDVTVEENVTGLLSNEGKNVEQLDGTTPSYSIVLKKNVSTPGKSLSHVRVLDFSTPAKAFTEGRRAFSSPKMSTRSMDGVNRKPFLTPSTNSKPKSRGIKFKLFPTITEIPSENIEKSKEVSKPECVKVEIVASGIWDEVHGVGQILKKSGASDSDIGNSLKIDEDFVDSQSISARSNKDSFVVSKSSTNKKVKTLKPYCRESRLTEEEIKEKEFEEEAAAVEWARIRNANKKSWDQEMRLVLATHSSIGRIPFSKKKKRKITSAKNPDDSDEMSKSTEDEGKLVEDALNRTTGLTPAKPSESSEKNLDMIKVEEYKAENISGDPLADNLNSEINSSQGEMKCDENMGVNNKDYLLQVKLFRDSMKTQQVENCKFVTYSNPHVARSQSSARKQRRTRKGKNTFKVKFACKNSKDSQVPDNEDHELIEVVDEVKMENLNVPEIIITNPQNVSEITSQEIAPITCVDVVVQQATKGDVVLTPTEPPVPAVKITPDMPREPDYHPMNAKCNLNLLLETPFKFEILDLHMDTPKFVSPGLFHHSLSSIKICDIPTPSFPFLPELTKTPVSMGKEPTPGSYSSRPTDYSSSSSYYKPDEIEFNLDIKTQHRTMMASPKNLSIVKEESEPEQVSQRVLRPRRSRTVYYPDANGKKSDSFNNRSCEKINTSKSKTPLKENIPKVPPNANIVPEPHTVRSEPFVKKVISRYSGDLSSNSSSESFMAEIRGSIIKTTSTPKISKGNHKSDENRKQLEEKRQRVLSKLKKTTPFKKSVHHKTKVSIKGKRVSNKISRISSTISPKVEPVKISNELPNASSSISDKDIRKEDVVVRHSNSSVTMVKTASSKSRRKSSTPRKLMPSEIASLTSPSSDGDHQLEKESLLSNGKGEILVKNEVEPDKTANTESTDRAVNVLDEKTSSNAPIDSGESMGDVCHDNKFKMRSESDEQVVFSSKIDAADDDYLSLHLSSDEVDTEPKNKRIAVVNEKVSVDSYDINEIKEFIATTSKKADNSAFRENVLKQGFDQASVEALEKELTEEPSLDNIFESHSEISEEPQKQDVVVNVLELDKTNVGEETVVDNKSSDSSQSASVKSVTVDLKDNENSADSKSISDSKPEGSTALKDSHKSSTSTKDRHKSHYKSSKKSPYKSPNSKKSHKHATQKPKTKLSLSEYKERKKQMSNKESKHDDKSKETGPEKEDKNLIDREKNDEQTKKVCHEESQESVDVIEKNCQTGSKDGKIDISNTDMNQTTGENVSEYKEKNDPCVTEETEEDIVVWSDYDCHVSSNCFITYEYVSSKAKRKPPKVVDISNFKIKATVFNSLIDDEDVRSIVITKHAELMELQPDRSTFQRFKRKDAKLRRESVKEKVEAEKTKCDKNKPLQKLIDEMVNATESQSSCHSLEDICDIKAINETKLAVKSILTEESSNNAFFYSPLKLNTNVKSSCEDMSTVCDGLKKHIIEDKSPDKQNQDSNDKVENKEKDTIEESNKKQEIVEVKNTTPVDMKQTLAESIIELNVSSSPKKMIEDVIDKQSTNVSLQNDTRSPSSNLVVGDKQSRLINFDDAVVSDKPSLSDLMNFAVVKSVDISKATKSNDSDNSSTSVGDSVVSAEKRKRDEGVESECLAVKKNKLSSPQSLLMNIDIDAVLSKLHGPK